MRLRLVNGLREDFEKIFTGSNHSTSPFYRHPDGIRFSPSLRDDYRLPPGAGKNRCLPADALHAPDRRRPLPAVRGAKSQFKKTLRLSLPAPNRTYSGVLSRKSWEVPHCSPDDATACIWNDHRSQVRMCIRPLGSARNRPARFFTSRTDFGTFETARTRDAVPVPCRDFQPLQDAMHYQNVCLEAFGYTLPQEIVTSEEIERRLEPLYRRLRLPAGRLELMSGIGERRFWEPEVLPSDKSVESGEKALRAAGLERRHVGALIHGSVCRDYLEPATACRVHHRLGLPPACTIYDVSNACLGLLNGILQAANMIELGHVRAALVVGTESSRPLIETTIETLNRDLSLTREAVKSAVASLTIGSGSCAVLLTDRELSRTGNRLFAAAVRCIPIIMNSAIATATKPSGAGCIHSWTRIRKSCSTRESRRAWRPLPTSCETRAGRQTKSIGRFATRSARASQADARIPGTRPTRRFHYLPLAGQHRIRGLADRHGHRSGCGFVRAGDNLALLGIGSGINSVMLGVRWQKRGRLPVAASRKTRVDMPAVNVTVTA